MNMITVGYGRISFSSKSALFSAMVVSDGWVRSAPSSHFQKRGATVVTNASAFADINGRMMLDTLDNVPDGVIICLQGSHSQGATPMRQGAVFVRVDSTGPVLCVSFNTPISRESTIRENQCLSFTGRGRIIPIKQVASYGVRMPAGWMHAYTDVDEIAECFNIAELRPELAPSTKVSLATNPDGEEVVVHAVEKKRAIRRR